MIICGFAGTGKSTAAKKIPGVVDLESTPFQKDWETYVRVAKHMSDNGYIVLLSCHQELRDELQHQDIEYYVVVPDPSCKEIYHKCYKKRGNTQAFIDMQMEHWDEWTATDQDERYIILNLIENNGKKYRETMSSLIYHIQQYGMDALEEIQ